jgi:hypothetical protein
MVWLAFPELPLLPSSTKLVSETCLAIDKLPMVCSAGLVLFPASRADSGFSFMLSIDPVGLWMR